MPNQIGWNLKLLGVILKEGQIHRWDFKGEMTVIAVCTQDLQMLGWWKMVRGHCYERSGTRADEEERWKMK